VTPTATPPLATVHGFAWEDQNRDGRRDPGEPGIAGLLVALRPAVTPLLSARGERRVTTDATGYYRFEDVALVTYIIRAERPARYLPTTDASLTVTPGQHQTLEVNFGFFRAPIVRYLPLIQR
jgi:hypothetical protein